MTQTFDISTPGSGKPLTDPLCTADHQHVFTLIQSHTGLRIHPSRAGEIARVVDHVLTSMRFAGVNDLMLALKAAPFTGSLWQTFIQAITIGETYFFRDQGQMNALRAHILPQIIDEHRKTGNRQLRLWSAGCATGEEPYTLVMLLHELLPDIENWRVMVLGTDINLAFLERARQGIFRASSFRNETPEYVQKRWFVPVPGGYQLDSVIRDKVTFVPLNLANSTHPQAENFTMNMDLIVCRNVTIYFDQPTVRDIIGRFYQALDNLGRLIVGHSELSTTLYHEFAARSHERIMYYQKADSVAAVPDRLWDVPVPAILPIAPSPRTVTPRAVTARPLPAPTPLPQSMPPAPEPQDQNLELVWSRAKAAADRENWEEALACLKQVENSHMFRPEFHYLHGLVHMAAANTDQALWAWRQALYCDPAFVLAHYSLGELYEQRGDHASAARHWRQAMDAVVQLDPQHRLLFSEDLTAEMLQGLLAFRVGTRQARDGREKP